MEYSITDDVTLLDAIRYAEEIYDSEIINSYIDSATTTNSNETDAFNSQTFC